MGNFKLHMCNLKSELRNLKKMPNRLKSRYLKQHRNSNCTSTKIIYVQFGNLKAGPSGTAPGALH